MKAYIFISVDNSKNRIIKIGIFDVIREIESIIDDYFGSLLYGRYQSYYILLWRLRNKNTSNCM